MPPPSLKGAENSRGALARLRPPFREQWATLVLARGRGRGRSREEDGRAGLAHIAPAAARVREEFLAMSSPRGAWQSQPGIWCLPSFSDKWWRVSTGAGRAGPNRSPLPAPSGGIRLLYADELFMVPPIWLLYKKHAGSAHRVNSHPRAYHSTARAHYYLKTSF